MDKDTSPFNDNSEILRQANSRLGLMIAELLWNDKDNASKEASYQNTLSPDQQVRLSAPPKSIELGNLKLLAPDLDGTIVEYSERNRKPTKDFVTTPYGNFTGIKYCATNGSFKFYNHYIFTVDGDGFKYEEMRPVNNDMTEGEIVGQLNFEPNTTNSRLVELDPGDYEKIGSILTQIKNGEFTQLRV